MITTSVRQIRAAILQEFAPEFADGRLYSLGVYNRRFIAGTRIWSQHSWGNAWNVGVRRDERHRGGAGDRLNTWLLAERRAGRLLIRLILWRIRRHFDHLHIEGAPKKRGTPPLPGRGGDDVKEVVRAIQKALVAAGFTDHEGKVLKVDGVLGPRTESAMVKRDKAAATLPETLPNHAHQGSGAPTGGIVAEA